MRLPPRLEAVATELVGIESFADIGTDHGKLPVYALLNKIVKTAIATDISAPSLNKAILLSERKGVLLDARLGKGFEPLAVEEVSAIVIAGMGGNEIIDILNSSKTFNKYILVPHKHTVALRKYLRQKNIGIIKDYVVRESGFYYHIITCSILHKWNNSHSVYIGSDNEGRADFAAYLTYRLNVLKTLIPKCGEKLEEFERERKELEKWQQ